MVSQRLRNVRIASPTILPLSDPPATPRPDVVKWLDRVKDQARLEVEVLPELPWIPFMVWEHLVVQCHYDAAAELTLGIPFELSVRVVITEEAYRAIYATYSGLLQQYGDAGQPTLAKLWAITDLNRLPFLHKLGLLGEERRSWDELAREESPRRCLWKLWEAGAPCVPLEMVRMTTDLSNRLGPNITSEFRAVAYAEGENVLHVALSSEQWAQRGALRSRHPGLEVACTTSAAVDRFMATRSNEPARLVGTASAAAGDLEFSSEPYASPHLDGDTPPLDCLQWILARGLREAASDIHFVPMNGRTRVLLRVDGYRHPIVELASSKAKEVMTIIKNRSKKDTSNTLEGQEGKFKAVIDSTACEVRVQTEPVAAVDPVAEAAFLRLIVPGLVRIERIHDLRIFPSQEELLLSLVGAPLGLILVTGPTGSGKTSTLHALLRHVTGDELNTLTVENPVELPLPGAVQVNVDLPKERTFGRIITEFLRCDPDYILVGETREHQEAKTLVEAAQTGHLVFTTLHANWASRAISRLLSLGVDSDLVADALIGVQAQRLVRLPCQHCQTLVRAPERWIQRVQHEVKNMPQMPGTETAHFIAEAVAWLQNPTVVVPAGCGHCANRGYHGRRAVMEVFGIDDKAKDLIYAKAGGSVLAEHFFKTNGYLPIKYNALRLVFAHATTIAELETVWPPV